MKTSSTFSILFWINTSRLKDNKADLFVRISRNKKRVNISLKTKISPKLWDSKKSKAKGNSHEARQINQLLDLTRSQIYQSYLYLKEKGGTITAHSIKANFLGEDKKNYSLTELFTYHNEKNQLVLNKYTLKHYATTQRYLLTYIQKEYKTSDYFLNDLNYGFIVGLESFLRSYNPRHYQKAIGQNAIMKHIQRLRKMVTLAFHMEWIERDPFVKFKPKILKKDRGFLTEQEITILENLLFSTERLEVVRDLFIFSCYTGISFGDIALLTPHNMIKGEDGNDWIITKRKKTNNSVKVPLLPEAFNIIQKYKDSPRTISRQTLLPLISNQKANAYLKEIGQQAQIKKKLTFHLARHTFATTITLNNGVPLETISKLLGHSELRTTQIYAKVVEKKVSADMMLLRQKIANKTKTSREKKPSTEVNYNYSYVESSRINKTSNSDQN